MSLLDTSNYSPRQKKIGMAAAAALGGVGIATALYLSRDLIQARHAATEHFVAAAKKIEPRMWTADTYWDVRHYMRNCNYKNPSKPHSYELQASFKAIALSLVDKATTEKGIRETIREAARSARLETDRDWDVDGFSYNAATHFKLGKVCHGLQNNNCVDSYKAGVLVRVGYSYEKKETYCAETDKDNKCVREATRYVEHRDSIANRYVFENINGSTTVSNHVFAGKLKIATMQAVEHGLSQVESRIKCKPVAESAGGGGAGADWEALSP